MVRQQGSQGRQGRQHWGVVRPAFWAVLAAAVAGGGCVGLGDAPAPLVIQLVPAAAVPMLPVTHTLAVVEPVEPSVFLPADARHPAGGHRAKAKSAKTKPVKAVSGTHGRHQPGSPVHATSQTPAHTPARSPAPSGGGPASTSAHSPSVSVPTPPPPPPPVPQPAPPSSSGPSASGVSPPANPAAPGHAPP